MSPLSLALILWLNDKTLETCKVDKPTCAQVCGSLPDLKACSGAPYAGDMSQNDPNDDVSLFIQMIMTLIAQANEPEDSPGYQRARAMVPQLVWPRRSIAAVEFKQAKGMAGFADSEKQENFAVPETIAPGIADIQRVSSHSLPAPVIPQNSMPLPQSESRPQSELPTRVKAMGSRDINTDIILGERSGGYSSESWPERKYTPQELKRIQNMIPNRLDLKPYMAPKRDIAGINSPNTDIWERISTRYRTLCDLGHLSRCK